MKEERAIEQLFPHLFNVFVSNQFQRNGQATPERAYMQAYVQMISLEQKARISAFSRVDLSFFRYGLLQNY